MLENRGRIAAGVPMVPFSWFDFFFQGTSRMTSTTGSGLVRPPSCRRGLAAHYTVRPWGCGEVVVNVACPPARTAKRASGLWSVESSTEAAPNFYHFVPRAYHYRIIFIIIIINSIKKNSKRERERVRKRK